MVAPKRISALSLTTLLLVSSFAFVTPTALAAPGIIKAEWKDNDNSSLPTTTLPVGMTIRFNIEAEVGLCTAAAGGSTAPVETATATVQIANRLRPTNLVLPMTLVGANWVASATITIAANQNPGVSGPAVTFPVTVAATCPTGLANVPPPDLSGNSGEINVDTVAPSGLALTLTHDCTVRACHATVPTAVASIGTTIGLSSGIVGATVLKWNLDNVVGTAGLVTIAPTTTFVVKAAGVDGFKTLADSATATSIPMRAEDAAGNFLDQTIDLNIDNVRPDPATFEITSATLTRSAAAASLALSWTATAGTSLASVQLTDATGTRIVGTVTSTGTIADLGLANGLTTAITNITLLPVDVAGNRNPTPTVTASPVFASGISVEYGGTTTPPVSIKGDGFRNLYVNVTSNAPTLPYPTVTPLDSNDLRIYGQLQRDFTATAPGAPSTAVWTTPKYWREGLSGSNAADDTNGHFQATQNLDPADTDAAQGNGRHTLFRPAHTATGAGAYLMTNLSGKSFVDGAYRLVVNVDSSAHKMFKTVIVRDITIDSTDPRTATGGVARNYTGSAGPGHGPGQNTTQAAEIHGMDNNPLRVLVNVTDWDTHNSGNANLGRKDSGFRNLSVELIDQNANIVRRAGGELARVDINPNACPAPGTTDRSAFSLPYCVKLPAADPVAGLTCSATTPIGVADVQNVPDCAWDEIVIKGRWNTTFVNTTQFSGWVNVTWPDLPAGKYRIRVSAWDNADRNKTTVYGGGSATDYYKVAPAVSMVTSAQTPRVDEQGRLLITPRASQFFVTPPSGRACDGNVCAADAVIVYVSNTNGANDVGVQYGGALSNISATDESTTLQANGWTDMNPSNGTMSLKRDLTVRLFPYSQGPVENLPALPSTIDVNQPVYVRIAALAFDANSNEIIRSTTEWVRVTSEIQAALTINHPKVDWAHNLSSQFGGSGQPKGPAFNVTFNRTGEGSGLPVLEYTIIRLNDTTKTVLGSGSNLVPLNSGSNAPRASFNWTGSLVGTGNTVLPHGVYQFHVKVKADSAATTPLAESFRNFTILPAPPHVEILPNSPLTTGIVLRNSEYYALSNFEIPFQVNHSYANLTSHDQIEIKLLRSTWADGQSPTVSKGQEGFDYTLVDFPTLREDFWESNLSARVTMPPGAPTGTRFQLQVTAKVDVDPFQLPGGNPTASLPITIDKQEPSGALRVPESESTVFVVNSDPPTNLANPAPKFRGFAEDFGSGVARVDVRVYDVTLNRTIRLDSSARGFTTTVGLSEAPQDWLTTANNGFVKGYDGTNIVPFSQLGGTSKEWIIDVSHIEDTDVIGGSPGIINLSHTYQIDVKVTDALNHQTPVANSTRFDFDAAPPTLGLLGRLNASAALRSGILSSVERMPWHGAALLTVNVTDNHCLGAVRLKGKSDLRPNLTVVAPMTLAGSSQTSICYAGMPHNTLADGTGTKFARYQVDLGQYHNFTEDVSNYTYWFEAEDMAGQITEVPQDLRRFRMEIFDATPARIGAWSIDPSPGQAGGRGLIRANVIENEKVSHVTVRITESATGKVVGNGTMRPDVVNNVTGAGWYVADTQDDLNFTLNVGEYSVEVVPHDVNWNRSSAAGGPTCPFFCLGSNGIYIVRDDGAPAVVLESPLNGATVNATPTFTFRALGKNLQQSGVTMLAGVNGTLTAVPAANLSFVELNSTTGVRQGWLVNYTPGALADNTTFAINVTANVGGLLNLSSSEFTVDALPPIVSANVTTLGNVSGKEWVVSSTRVVLTAEDNVSATTIHYKVNGGATQTYAGEITPTGADGDWVLEYWARDAAGNEAQKQTLTLSLDLTGPRISIAKHGDEILLTVTDNGVGLNESSVVVHYRYPPAQSYSTKVAEKVAGNSFTVQLPGNATETGLSYYVTAEDNLGRAANNFTAAQPFTIPKGDGGEVPPPPDNNPPTVRITSPTTGQSVRGTLELKWLAEDPEGVPLTITIALRDPAPGRVLVTAGENSGSYTANLSGLPAGGYTVVVTANDGEKSASSQVTFSIEAGETIQIRNVPPPTVAPNTPVSIGVAIEPAGKTVATASYRLLKDGQLYATGRLTQTQGVYGASLAPGDAGAYTVIVDVAYTDGTSEASKQVAAFSVPGGSEEGTARTFPVSMIALVAVSVLTIGLGAYGAFGRWRK